MTDIRCASCGELVEIPAELAGNGPVMQTEPYYCDACQTSRELPDWAYDVDEEEPEENFCDFCGHNIYDFSDLGCGHCDRRSPDWGIL